MKLAQKSMTVTVLGCGTSVGSPMIGRQRHPMFRNPKNVRLRASVLLEPFGRPGPAVLIDTSPDLRVQALRFFPAQNPRLDAILFTHTHADHLHGIDDIRPFNFSQERPIRAYASSQSSKEIRTRFPYIFQPSYEGGGKPRLHLKTITSGKFKVSFSDFQEIEVIPLPLRHGSSSCLGFRIGRFAYIADCSYIPEKTLEKLTGLDLLILDCLRPAPHTTHLHVEASLAYARKINAAKTVLTHMGWELEYESFKKSLPKRIVPAYDGMKLKVHK